MRSSRPMYPAAWRSPKSSEGCGIGMSTLFTAQPAPRPARSVTPPPIKTDTASAARVVLSHHPLATRKKPTSASIANLVITSLPSARGKRARTSSAQAPERSGETWGKCPEKARSRSGHALVASWSCTGTFDDHAHAVALRVSSPGASATSCPVCPCRCFGLRPSSAIFGLSRQPQQRPLGFRDLLAQDLFQDPVHPRPHPPFSRQPSVVFPSGYSGSDAALTRDHPHEAQDELHLRRSIDRNQDSLRHHFFSVFMKGPAGWL